MKLELRHLEALCSIAEAGSIRKAARLLGVSQPALTTQVLRIEKTFGGKLFVREQNGCRPTPLGQAVLSRACPLVAQMSLLLTEIRAAAVRVPGSALRVGATANRSLPGWLRRLRQRFPGRPVSLHMNASAHALLQDLAQGRLDIAFVHEMEGSALRVPAGLESWTLLEREPQFIAMAVDHAAAALPVVDIAALAEDHWLVDPSVEGELTGLRRALFSAGINPPMLQADRHTASTIVAIGAAVALCSPLSDLCHDLAVRPLRDDPITVRLRAYYAAGTETELIRADLKAAYREAALLVPAYRRWLTAHGDPLDQ
ncbi:LysR family transcriptional regulator [Streptomyces aureus]|uniref:LysR family transcriptional regulator n=1 Tax=Streptomyces aureus TaxID=193461 RepID=UPI003406E9BD